MKHIESIDDIQKMSKYLGYRYIYFSNLQNKSIYLLSFITIVCMALSFYIKNTNCLYLPGAFLIIWLVILCLNIKKINLRLYEIRKKTLINKIQENYDNANDFYRKESLEYCIEGLHKYNEKNLFNTISVVSYPITAVIPVLFTLFIIENKTPTQEDLILVVLSIFITLVVATLIEASKNKYFSLVIILRDIYYTTYIINNKSIIK